MGLGNGDGLQAMPPADIRTGTAVSGLLLVLFILVHLLGLIPALVAPDQFEAYATALHASPWLPLVEISLVLMALVHIGLSLSKAISNRQAGNSAQLSSRRQAPLAALASRSTVAAGLLTLVFLAVHLGQLRWPRPPSGAEAAVLSALLHQPINAVLYGLAALALGLHLLHGAEAAHRSMGWLTPTNSVALRRGGRLLAGLISGGFLLVSLGLALGGKA